MRTAPIRALLIDDEEELVATMVERLEHRDVQARYVTNGSDGLSLLRRETFDVVVLDVKLPGMSGLDVLRAINAEHPRLPVLLITGHGSITDLDAEIPPGACDCLPKPIKLDLLVDKMREAVENRN